MGYPFAGKGLLHPFPRISVCRQSRPCDARPPATSSMSSCQRPRGRPRALRASRGYQCRTRSVHRSSSALATCPAHLHFSWHANLAASIIFVFLRMYSFFTRSRNLMSSMLLSMARWKTCNLFIIFFERTQF